MEDSINKKIREKIKEEMKETPDLAQKIKEFHNMELEDFMFVLGDRDAFKQKFLIPHYKMYNLLKEINQKVQELRKNKLSEENLKKELDYFNEKQLELAESKLEIFFCNAVSGDPKLLKFIANMAMPFGLTHAGILVDDLCINWGRGLLGKSLIHPWINCKYNDYIYAIELDNKEIWELIKKTFDNITDYITGKKIYEEMGTLKAFRIVNSQLDAIAETCVDYNINRKYHLATENCQGFVTTILNKIKLKPNKKGEVGRVLKIVEDKGDIIDFTYDGKKFNNRKELDEYVLQIDFDKLPYDHRMVLFCYRNVFEYYLRNNPDDKKYISSDYAKEYWKELSFNKKFK
jgi:hypothetical protein